MTEFNELRPTDAQTDRDSQRCDSLSWSQPPKPSSAAHLPDETPRAPSRSARPQKLSGRARLKGDTPPPVSPAGQSLKPRGPAQSSVANQGKNLQATRSPNHQAQRSTSMAPDPMPRESDGPSSDSPAQVLADARFNGSQAVDLGDDGAQPLRGTLPKPSPVVAEIIQMWRLRQRWHRAEKSLILQGKALCRAFTAGDKESANALFEKASSGEASDPIVAIALGPFLTAIDEFKPKRKAFERQLEKLAKSLPIWPWITDLKGFGALNLAALIGEAGDIGSYRNPSCLWKRMGMAVIDGGRQRKIADADLALVHGYNPARRSVAWNIGCCLIKKPNRYRIVYDERKAAMLAREGMTKGHAHNDAMRFMTKRILRDLWVEWPR